MCAVLLAVHWIESACVAGHCCADAVGGEGKETGEWVATAVTSRHRRRKRARVWPDRNVERALARYDPGARRTQTDTDRARRFLVEPGCAGARKCRAGRFGGIRVGSHSKATSALQLLSDWYSRHCFTLAPKTSEVETSCTLKQRRGGRQSGNIRRRGNIVVGAGVTKSRFVSARIRAEVRVEARESTLWL